ncbi:MAG TPA: hypothetical protein VJ302_08105 [Blastocatellia bacterium]|nr:hypothetical protein [Blastocatellia bacterium]
MNLDIRSPIGLMFTIFGVLLVIYGLTTSGDSMYTQQSLGINVNLWWGAAVLLFGIVTLFLAWRKSAVRPAGSSSEGGKGSGH